MTHLLIAFLVVLLLPLFTATWRTSLLGLALQGFLLGWISLRMEPQETTSSLFALLDLFLLRGLIAPGALLQVVAAGGSPRRADLIPSNLFWWALVGALVMISFRFAGAVSGSGINGSLHLAVATVAVVLGMFVLSSQKSRFGQIVGLLRIENGVALFELMAPQAAPAPVRAGLSAVFLITVLLLARFLEGEGPRLETSQPDLRPTL